MQRGFRVLVASAFFAATSLVIHADVNPALDSAEVQLQLGNLLFGHGQFLGALEAYQRALSVPEFARAKEARSGVVRSAIRLARFQLARTEAETLVKADPRSAPIVAQYADALWACGLFDAAESAYREALSIDPKEPRAIHGLARSLMSQNQLERALSQSQAALELAPDDAEMHHTVGAIYERMHRFEDAVAEYRKYVALLPNTIYSIQAAWARAQIRFLQSFGGRTPYQMERGAGDVLHTLDFKLVNHKILVRARINGRNPRDLVVDTGAENTTITEQTAQQDGVDPITYTLTAGVGTFGVRGLQLGRIDALEVGSLRLRNVPCLIKSPPLRGLPTEEPESFSPLAMGLSMVIDYQAQQLIIGRRLPAEPADFELPLRMYRLATVRGTVDREHQVDFVVDTGGEVISISEATATSLGMLDGRRRQVPLKVYGTSGWDQSAYLLSSVDLSFDAIEYNNFPVVVLNLDAPSVLLGYQLGGIVGHRFLSRYRVGMDLNRSVLRLKELS